MGQLGYSEYCYWGNWVNKGEIILGAWDEDQYAPTKDIQAYSVSMKIFSTPIR